MGEYTKYTNKALIKIGDKFTIDYIIDNFKIINNIEFIITLGYYGDFVKQYLLVAYPELKFTFITIDNYENIGSSQGYSLLKTKNYIQEPFIFIACDTIILDKLYNDSNYEITNNKIYVYKSNNSNNYSTIICENNKVKSVNDKGEKFFDYIYVGKCQIYNYKEFWDNLEKKYNEDTNNSSLGDIMSYNLMIKQNINFNYQILDKWYDAGTIDIFNSDINTKLNYNVLVKLDESISFHENKVVKFFYNKDKNLKRLERLKYIEDLCPKILNKSDNFHSMEKIDSKPISEIKDHQLIKKLLYWSFDNLWINYNTPNNFKDIIYDFYYNKTIKRINMALDNNISDFNKINNTDIGDIFSLLSKINFDDLCKSSAFRFHGDYILDNILLKNNNFILIDWREDFGGDLKNGDIYYDLSKLKHNIYFNHNNIQNNLFKFEKIDSNSCLIDLKCNYDLIIQIKDFEEVINQKNLSNKKINILMSLIWINMAPLHEYPLNNFLFNLGKYNLFLCN